MRSGLARWGKVVCLYNIVESGDLLRSPLFVFLKGMKKLHKLLYLPQRESQIQTGEVIENSCSGKRLFSVFFY